MFMTRPSVEKHKAAIADEIVKAAQQGGLNSTAIVCWDFEGKNKELLEKVAISPDKARESVAEEVGKTLTLKNFWLCNVGTVTLEGKQRNVSLGAFGHVFCTGLK